MCALDKAPCIESIYLTHNYCQKKKGGGGGYSGDK